MRVLITTDSYHPQVNGAAIFAQRLATGLVVRGHDVAVVAPGTSLRRGLTTLGGAKLFGVASMPVGFYKDFRLALPVGLQQTAREIVASFRPDVIHAQGHFTVSKAVISHARATSLPVVGTNHFMPENLTHYAHLPCALERRVQRLMWQQFRRVYEEIDIVTTPTASAARYMQQSGLAADILVISNGVDLERFAPLQARPGLLTKYGLPASPLLLYVGRLDREKNIDLVLRALARLPDVPIHFAIGGCGARRRSLQRLASALRLDDSVTFLGFVPDEDLPALYATADCFVMAGVAELQSIATMEAMASGLPVLAAAAVALPELVHQGVNGYLFEPGDAEMLAEQLRAVFTNPDLRQRMARASTEMIQHHALRSTLDEFEAAYAAVTEPRRRASW